MRTICVWGSFTSFILRSKNFLVLNSVPIISPTILHDPPAPLNNMIIHLILLLFHTGISLNTRIAVVGSTGRTGRHVEAPRKNQLHHNCCPLPGQGQTQYSPLGDGSSSDPPSTFHNFETFRFRPASTFLLWWWHLHCLWPFQHKLKALQTIGIL